MELVQMGTPTPTTEPQKKSRTMLYAIIIVVIIIVAGVIAYGLGLFGPAAACANKVTVNAVNNSTDPSGYSFSPKVVTSAGCVTITWHNSSTYSNHSVTSTSANWSFNQLLTQNQTYTFNSAGTYTYECTPHAPYMTGTIIVTAT